MSSVAYRGRGLVCLPRGAVERLVRLALATADAHEAGEQPQNYVEARLMRQAEIVERMLGAARNEIEPGSNIRARDAQRRRRRRSRRR